MRHARHPIQRHSVIVSAIAVFALSAVATSAVSAQVRIEARLEKSSYIVGEPVFVTADVTNAFAEPIAYHDRGLTVGQSLALEVANSVPPGHSPTAWPSAVRNSAYPGAEW